MKEIINKVEDEDYVQWIKKFVTEVLEYASVKYKEVIIDNIEPNRRIFLLIDGNEYTIRTWDYHPVGYDDNGEVCSEEVEYTLFKTIEGEHSAHGEIVDDGYIRIDWKN